MKLMQACLCARKLVKPGKTEKAFFSGARAGLLKCQERWRKQFSPLRRSWEAREGQFTCQEKSIKQCGRTCEARRTDRQTSETEILGLLLVVETGSFLLGLSADQEGLDSSRSKSEGKGDCEGVWG